MTSAKRIYTKLNMFLYERIFIPINHNNEHWALAVIGNFIKFQLHNNLNFLTIKFSFMIFESMKYTV